MAEAPGPFGMGFLTEFMQASRRRTRRIEWIDGDGACTALLVRLGTDDVLAHWLRLPCDGTGAALRVGSTLVKNAHVEDVATFTTADDPWAVGNLLGEVLPTADGDVVRNVALGMRNPEWLEHRWMREACAAVIAPAEGMLLAWLRDGTLPAAPVVTAAAPTAEDATERDSAWMVQAAKRYPAFAEDMEGTAMAGVAALVRAGKPFEGALAGALARTHRMDLASGSTGAAAVRRLRGIDLHDADKADAVWCLANLRAEWLPTSVDAWRSLCTVARAYRESGLPVAEIPLRLSGGLGDWSRYEDRILSSGVGLGLRADPSRVRALHGALADTLVVPAALRRDMPLAHALAVARDLAFGDAGFVAVLRRGAYLGDCASVVERLPDRTFDMSWPALFPEQRDLGGMVATCLSDGAMVHDDAMVADNGAREHMSRIASGKTHLLSVRQPGRVGPHLATVVVAVGEGPSLRIVRVLGYPRPADRARALAAVDILAGRVREGRLRLDPDALATRRPAPTLVSLDREPPASDARLSRIAAVWRPLLWRGHRDLDLPKLDRLLDEAVCMGTR